MPPLGQRTEEAVRGALEGKTVPQVSLGQTHNACVTSNGKNGKYAGELYTCGGAEDTEEFNAGASHGDVNSEMRGEIMIVPGDHLYVAAVGAKGCDALKWSITGLELSQKMARKGIEDLITAYPALEKTTYKEVFDVLASS